MAEITIRKRLNVVRLYLRGLHYQEIASRAGVSKGTDFTGTLRSDSENELSRNNTFRRCHNPANA